MGIKKAHKMHLPRHISCGFLFAVATALMVTGCARIRLLTYPAEFTWIGNAELSSTMQDMAISMGKLNELANDTSKVDNAAGAKWRQVEVLSELDLLEILAGTLLGSSSKSDTTNTMLPATNHLLIDDHIEDFLTDIGRARFLAEDDPPNYFAVGQLTGSCNGCHRLR
jgi:hypothetical protein